MPTVDIRRIGRLRPRHVARWTRGFARTRTLVALLAVTGAFGLFVFIAEAVGSGATRAFDRQLLLALRNAGDPQLPFGPPWFRELARDITGFGSVGVLSLVTAAAAGFLLIQRNYRSLVLTVVSVATGMTLSMLLKLAFERPRPDLVPHGSFVSTASFPSGHALMSAVTYLTIAALVARVEPRRSIKLYIITLAATLTAMIGASRVYLGVHWPSDVAAGWSVGAAWALSCWLVARWLEKRGVVEPERDEEAPAVTTERS